MDHAYESARFKKEDFNGDNNCDIRIIYSESEKGTRYNLFLWSDKAGRFVECMLYNTITDPVYNSETGEITGVTDKGVFGKVTKTYCFNSSSGLDELTCTIEGVDSVAATVAKAIGGESVERIVNTVTVDEKECTAYSVISGGKKVGYVAATPDSVWYVDAGCCGLYRETGESESGEVLLGDYLGEARAAFNLAKLMGGEDVSLVGMTYGLINGSEAQRFGAKKADGASFAVACDENSVWYYSENGTAFLQVISSTGDIVGEEEVEFAIPEE